MQEIGKAYLCATGGWVPFHCKSNFTNFNLYPCGHPEKIAVYDGDFIAFIDRFLDQMVLTSPLLWFSDLVSLVATVHFLVVRIILAPCS